MKIRLSILFGLLPCMVFAEGQHGMGEWIIKMTIQSLIFYTLSIGILLTLVHRAIRKRISKRDTLIDFGIGFVISVSCLIISIISEIGSAYMIPYLMFLDLFR